MKRVLAAVDAMSGVTVLFVALALLWSLFSGRSVFQLTDSGRNVQPTLVADNVEDKRLSLPVPELAGKRERTITIVEYSDFQCPFCAQFSRDTLGRIRKELIKPERVSYVFRHYPLRSLHPHAVKAAEAVACAEKQGKFWEMHDMLFRNQQSLAESDLKSYSLSLKLDTKSFATCLNGEMSARVNAQTAEGINLGVSSTPTFLVGTTTTSGTLNVKRVIRGAQPFEVFENAIREIEEASRPTNYGVRVPALGAPTMARFENACADVLANRRVVQEASALRAGRPMREHRWASRTTPRVAASTPNCDAGPSTSVEPSRCATDGHTARQNVAGTESLPSGAIKAYRRASGESL